MDVLKATFVGRPDYTPHLSYVWTHTGVGLWTTSVPVPVVYWEVSDILPKFVTAECSKGPSNLFESKTGYHLWVIDK